MAYKMQKIADYSIFSELKRSNKNELQNPLSKINPLFIKIIILNYSLGVRECNVQINESTFLLCSIEYIFFLSVYVFFTGYFSSQTWTKVKKKSHKMDRDQKVSLEPTV
ncbi:hypothetical protein BpHYR1_051133 [Brachionus plicatilis]|uniref:Uncharacterized protein n=1 Tax=Brachionus plicatilis TaxID=10195 RepID=A0A3M7S0K8_BRAPC|nr:hypothetical protein BpHYR1_051133 [Brachionus plicatilis]